MISSNESCSPKELLLEYHSITIIEELALIRYWSTLQRATTCERSEASDLVTPRTEKHFNDHRFKEAQHPTEPIQHTGRPTNQQSVTWVLPENYFVAGATSLARIPLTVHPRHRLPSVRVATPSAFKTKAICRYAIPAVRSSRIRSMAAASPSRSPYGFRPSQRPVVAFIR